MKWIGLCGMCALAISVPAASETVHLSDAYRLVFSDGTAVLSPLHSQQNAKALERLAALMGRFGGRRDMRVLAQAVSQDEIAAQRLYAVRAALSSAYGVPFQKLESLGLTGGGDVVSRISFALKPQVQRSNDCPWDLILQHPAMADGEGLRFSAGLEDEIDLPEGSRLLAEPASPHPHSLAFAFTSRTTGYLLGDRGATAPAYVLLTVSNVPIPLPQVSRNQPPSQEDLIAQGDAAPRAIGNDIRPPNLVPTPSESVTCSIKVVQRR